MKQIFPALLLCLGLSVSASSADLTGHLERAGMPAADQPLELRTAAGTVLARAMTDSNGWFRVRSLPAGTIIIAIDGRTLGVDIADHCRTLVFLTDDGASLRRRHPGFEAVVPAAMDRIVIFPAGFLDQLPLPLGYGRILPLLPFVGEDEFPRIHGGTPRENVWLLNGIEIADPDEGVRAMPGAPYETIALENSLAEGLGVVTRSGGAELHGSGSLYYLGSDFPEEIDSLSYERERQLFIPSAALGSSWRTFSWFIAATWHREDYRATPGRLEAEERTAPLALARMQYRPVEALFLDLTLGGHDDTRAHAFAPDSDYITVTAPSGEATASRIRTGWYGGLDATWRFSAETTFTAAASFFIDDYTIQPVSGNRARSSLIDLESLRPALLAGSWEPGWREDRQRRNTISVGATTALSFLGEHELSLSGGLSAASIDRAFAMNGGWRTDWSPLTDAAWRRVALEQDGRLHVGQQISIDRLHLTLTDRWTIASRVTAGISLTSDRLTGGNGAADGIFSWTSLSPRFGLAWDIAGDGETVIDAVIERRYDGLRGVNIPGDPYLVRTQYWDALTGSWETSPLNTAAAAGYDPANIAAGIDRPYYDQARVGVSRRLNERSTLTIDARWRMQQDLFEDVETNLWDYYATGTAYDEESLPYTFYIVRPGADGTRTPVYILSTVPGLEREYLSLDAALRADLGEVLLYGAYTWSRSRGTIDNSLAESTGFSRAWNSPNERINAEGFLSGDRRHALRLAAVWRAPWDIVVSSLLRFDSGQPLDRLLLNHDTGVFEIRGDERGSVYRTTALATIDLHLEKTIPLGTRSVTAMVDLFNLSDDDAAIEFARIDDLIGRPLAVREPRQVRWGLRIGF